MDLDQMIKDAVEPIVPVCVADVYGGDEAEYCVYTYDESPEDFGDDYPLSIIYTVRVHWFFPWRPNITASEAVKAKKKQLKHALRDAGFVYPKVSNGSDDQWAELVFETEILDGDV